MCLQDRSRGAHGDLEVLALDAVAVEQHRDLVARRVLELLHHKAPALRGRAPVHLPQRLAVHVLADAVQLVARRTPQEEPSAVLCVGAALREQPLERDEPRVDDERLRLALHELRPRETERILHGEPHGVERVAATGHRPQLVAARKALALHPMQLHPSLAEPARPLVRDEGRRRDRARRLDFEIDADVVALDDVARRPVAADVRRTGGETDPRDRDHDGEQQPDGDGVQRVRAEDPRSEIDDEAERCNCAAAVGH